MIRWLVGLSLVISSFTAKAQQSISFTVEEVRAIANELAAYDGAKYIINLQDSMITVYQETVLHQNVAIEAYKLSAKEYQKVDSICQANRKVEREIFEKKLHDEKGRRVLSFIQGGAIVGFFVWLCEKLTE
jgi:hypothetical protein